MATIPPPTDSTVSRIWKAWADRNDDSHRSHLGASQIGDPCERKIWYGFRWAKKESLDGRILRLFETGRMAEERLARDLADAGATVHLRDPDTGEQFRFTDHGGHFAGSMDGAGVGFPEAPAKWHVIEFKTHNEKSFSDLVNKGVAESKPEHVAQMQVYMGWSGMERALYVALNKNTDDIYIERVRFDRKEFERIRNKAAGIIFGNEPPDRISDRPAYYICKMCRYQSICHEMGELAGFNCRTCVHSEAREDGRWWCAHHKRTINKAIQAAGCENHKFRTGMVPEAVTKVVEAFNGTIDGVPF